MGYTAGLSAFFLVSAALYSGVGHAGASGYLAAMVLAGMDPAAMRPTAPVLNVLVAAIATARFAAAGCLDRARLWPLVLGSVPLAFVGGAVALPGRWFKVAVGLVMIFGAW